MKLDIGCGKNKQKGFIGIDVDPKSDADIISNAVLLPFRNFSIYEVYCKHLLEHFNPNETNTFLKEIYRVLKHEGKFHFLCDIDLAFFILKMKDKTHKYRYNLSEIRDLLKGKFKGELKQITSRQNCFNFFSLFLEFLPKIAGKIFFFLRFFPKITYKISFTGKKN